MKFDRIHYHYCTSLFTTYNTYFTRQPMPEQVPTLKLSLLRYYKLSLTIFRVFQRVFVLVLVFVIVVLLTLKFENNQECKVAN